MILEYVNYIPIKLFKTDLVTWAGVSACGEAPNSPVRQGITGFYLDFKTEGKKKPWHKNKFFMILR